MWGSVHLTLPSHHLLRGSGNWSLFYFSIGVDISIYYCYTISMNTYNSKVIRAKLTEALNKRLAGERVLILRSGMIFEIVMFEPGEKNEQLATHK